MRYILASTVSYFFDFLNFMIVIRVFLSWIRYSENNRIVSLVFQLTDPILEPFRRLSYRLGLNTGMIDFTPMITLLVLYYVIKPLILTIIATFF
jgi:YggT family protein